MTLFLVIASMANIAVGYALAVYLGRAEVSRLTGPSRWAGSKGEASPELEAGPTDATSPGPADESSAEVPASTQVQNLGDESASSAQHVPSQATRSGEAEADVTPHASPEAESAAGAPSSDEPDEEEVLRELESFRQQLQEEDNAPPTAEGEEASADQAGPAESSSPADDTLAGIEAFRNQLSQMKSQLGELATPAQESSSAG